MREIQDKTLTLAFRWFESILPNHDSCGICMSYVKNVGHTPFFGLLPRKAGKKECRFRVCHRSVLGRIGI